MKLKNKMLNAEKILKKFEKYMLEKGIDENGIREIVKKGKSIILPAKMVRIFTIKYGYNPNIICDGQGE